MAALLHDALPTEAQGSAAPAIQQMAQAEAKNHSHTTSVYKSVMPELVKGEGFAGPGGNAPLTDRAQILTKAAQATLDLRSATWQGFKDRRSVVAGLNQNFLGKYGALRTALTQTSPLEAFSEVISKMPGGQDALNKSFTAGNLGVGSVG